MNGELIGEDTLTEFKSVYKPYGICDYSFAAKKSRPCSISAFANLPSNSTKRILFLIPAKQHLLASEYKTGAPSYILRFARTHVSGPEHDSLLKKKKKSQSLSSLLTLFHVIFKLCREMFFYTLKVDELTYSCIGRIFRILFLQELKNFR